MLSAAEPFDAYTSLVSLALELSSLTLGLFFCLFNLRLNEPIQQRARAWPGLTDRQAECSMTIAPEYLQRLLDLAKPSPQSKPRLVEVQGNGHATPLEFVATLRAIALARC